MANKKGEVLIYAKDLPWQGIGAEIDHIDSADKKALQKMMKVAKVDWRVEPAPLLMRKEQPLTYPGYDYLEVPAQALVRSDNGFVLDVVGPKYVPVQNAQAFEFLQEMLDAGGAKMQSMGSVRNGQYVWAMADLGKTFTVGKNDTVQGYLFIGCPHQQGKSLLMKNTSRRMACNNMIASMIRRTGKKHDADIGTAFSEVRRAHRSEFDAAAIAQAKTSLGISRENFEAFGVLANQLHKMKTDEKIAIEILQPIFAPKFDGIMTMDTLTPRMAQLMDILKNAPGAEPDTAWGILNAATYYNTHVAGKSNDRRFYQNMFAKGAQQTQQVIQLLTR